MTDAKYDVLGIGNAIFDVLVQTDEGFLARHGMTKGGMALIDEARAAAIYKDMGPATEMSGGSGANTIVGVAGFGARAAFIGKVKNDQIGSLYTHDIRAAGAAFETKAAAKRPRHRLLLHPGDAGRRAHHEHLSRRRAGSDARGHRRSADRGLPHRLSRRLSLGSEERQGSLRQGRGHRARRRPPGGADAVGFLLRRIAIATSFST